MPIVDLPFRVEEPQEVHGGDPFSCSLYKMLPEPMQESTREYVYLLEYLHMIPIKEVGIPEFYPLLSRRLGDLETTNPIYPVEGGLFIHVIDDPEGGRAYYICIEPTLSQGLDEAELVRRTEKKMLDYAMEFDHAETPEEEREVLEAILDRLYQRQPTDESGLIGLLKKLIRKTSDEGMSLTGITHIKLPGSKQRTILDESHRSISHGCRQPSNQAHKTISRRGELAAPGSGGGFHHVCTPFKLLRARTSPLVASLHL